jgi:hypothetical protein
MPFRGLGEYVGGRKNCRCPSGVREGLTKPGEVASTIASESIAPATWSSLALTFGWLLRQV